MKKFYSFIIAALALLQVTSCVTPEIDPAEGDKSDSYIEVVKSDLVIPAKGGVAQVVVSASDAVTVEVDKKWLEVSVSSDTVFFAAEENLSLNPRYSKATLSCGEKKVNVSIQQRGYLSVDFEAEDIKTGKDSLEVVIPYSYDELMEASADVDWIIVNVTEDALKISIKANTTQASEGNLVREGAVSWKLGVDKGTINVSQLNANLLKVEENWTVTYDGIQEYQGEDVAVVTNTWTDANALNGKYYIDVISKDEFVASGLDMETYIYTVALPAYKELVDQLIAYYKQNYQVEFTYADFLYEGTDYEIFNPFDNGDYIGYALGVDDNLNLTTHFASVEFTVEGGSNPPAEGYDAWLGTWTKGSETWVISEKVNGSTYNITGIGGKDYAVEAIYGENNNTLTVLMQEGIGSYTHGTYGECSVGVYGGFNTSSFARGGSAYPIFVGTLSGDTATLTPSEIPVSGQTGDFNNIFFIGTSADSKYILVGKSELPGTLTRVGGGGDNPGGGEAYEKFLGTWECSVDGVDYKLVFSEKVAGSSYTVTGFYSDFTAEVLFNSSKNTAEAIFQELGSSSSWTYYLAGDDGQYMAYGDNENGVLASFSIASDGKMSLVGNSYTYTYSDGTTHDFVVKSIGLYGYGTRSDGSTGWVSFSNVNYFDLPMSFAKTGEGGGGDNPGGGDGSEAYNNWIGYWAVDSGENSFTMSVAQGTADKDYVLRGWQFDNSAFASMAPTFEDGNIALKADTENPIAAGVDIGASEGVCDIFYAGTIIYTDGEEYIINGTYDAAIGAIGSDGKATFTGTSVSLQAGGEFPINRFEIIAIPQSSTNSIYTFQSEPNAFPLTATKGGSSSSLKSLGSAKGTWVKNTHEVLSMPAASAYGEFGKVISMKGEAPAARHEILMTPYEAKPCLKGGSKFIKK